MFSSKNCIILVIMFRFFMYFEIISVYGIRKGVYIHVIYFMLLKTLFSVGIHGLHQTAKAAHGTEKERNLCWKVDYTPLLLWASVSSSVQFVGRIQSGSLQFYGALYCADIMGGEQ